MTWTGGALDRARRCTKCGAWIDPGRIVSETAQWFVARGTHVECALAPTWARGAEPISIAPDAMPDHARRQAQLRDAFNRRALFGADRLDARGGSIDSDDLDRAVREGEIEQLTDHLGRPIVRLIVDLDPRGRRVDLRRCHFIDRSNPWIRTAKYCFDSSSAGGLGDGSTYPGLARGAIFAVHAARPINLARAFSLVMLQRGSIPMPLVWIVGGARDEREARAMDARRWLDFVGYSGDLAHVFHSRGARTRREVAALIEAFEGSQRPELARVVADVREEGDPAPHTVRRLESFAVVGDWTAVRSILRLELSLRPPPHRRGDGDPRIAFAILPWLDVSPVRRVVLNYLATIKDRSIDDALARWVERAEGRALPPRRDAALARVILGQLALDSAADRALG